MAVLWHLLNRNTRQTADILAESRQDACDAARWPMDACYVHPYSAEYLDTAVTADIACERGGSLTCLLWADSRLFFLGELATVCRVLLGRDLDEMAPRPESPDQVWRFDLASERDALGQDLLQVLGDVAGHDAWRFAVTATPATSHIVSLVDDWPEPLSDAPDLETIREWLDECGSMATDGDCWVEPDGVCPHGYPSWLLYLGMI